MIIHFSMIGDSSVHRQARYSKLNATQWLHFFMCPLSPVCLTYSGVPSANKVIEPQHDKTNKMTCAASEDSDQPGRSASLIKIFAVRFLDS